MVPKSELPQCPKFNVLHTCSYFGVKTGLSDLLCEKTFDIRKLCTCILLEMESLSLRISCRCFVPRMFLRVVWASSLVEW